MTRSSIFHYFRLLTLLLTLFSASLLATPVENFKGSLTVNQGALNYSVELELPKGVAGVAPKLSLNYSSSAGNGILGEGWSIGGLSSISRCGSNMADDGINRVVKYDEKDNFCLDGQRLVKLNGTKRISYRYTPINIYGFSQEEASLTSESENDYGYRIQVDNYSRIEAVKEKINPWESDKSYKAPISWKISTKSGEVREYKKIIKRGEINSSWLLTKISDTYGNSIEFHYSESSLVPHLDYITYADNKIEFIYDKRKDIKEGYIKGEYWKIDEKLTQIVIKTNDENIRDYRLNYFSQKDSFDTLKLQSIVKCVDSECTEPLSFQWSDDKSKLLFEKSDKLSMRGTIKLVDFNKDGLADIYEIKSGNDNIWLNNGDGTFEKSSTIAINATEKDIKFIDFNQDGYVDIYEANGVKDDVIWLNNGSGEFEKSDETIAIKSRSENLYFIDIDGDKDIDIFQLNTNMSDDKVYDSLQIYKQFAANPFTKRGSSILWKNDGDMHFSKNEFSIALEYSWFEKFDVTRRMYSCCRSIHNQYLIPNQLTFTDMNNDGKLDLLVGVRLQANYAAGLRDELKNSHMRETTGYKTQVYINDGDSFYYLETINQDNIASSYIFKPIVYIDLNGDGVTDILDGNEKKVYYSKELNGEYANPSYSSRPIPYVSSSIKKTHTEWDMVELPMTLQTDSLKFVDLNGDGSVDILHLKSGRDDIWLNDGKGNFSLYETHPNLTVGASNIQFSDLNGDGAVDIYEVKSGRDNIWLNDGKATFKLSDEHPNVNVSNSKLALTDIDGDGLNDIVPLLSNQYIFLNRYQSPMIETIKDAFSNEIKVEYDSLSSESIYTKDDSRENEDIINISSSAKVVSRVIMNNGIGGDNIEEYTYFGLKRDLYRGSLGFKTIIKTDNYGFKTETTYYQEFPLVGNTKEIISSLNGEITSESRITLRSKEIEVTKEPSKGYSFGYRGIQVPNYAYDEAKIARYYKVYQDKTTSLNYNNGELISTTTNSYDEYDKYGNILKMTTTTEGGGKRFIKTTTSSYINNERLWLLGRLVNSEVLHSGDGEEITRKSSFTYNMQGAVKSETIEPGNSLALTKKYEYDSHGNLIKESTFMNKKITLPSTCNYSSSYYDFSTYSFQSCTPYRFIKEVETRYIYDYKGKYLLKTINPLGHSNRANNKYNALGQLIESTNANGLTTKVEYDAWGKKTKEIHADGTTTTYSYAFDTSVDGAKYAITVKSTGSPATTTYYDSFDRTIRVKTRRFDGKEVFVDTIYNEKSEVYQKSLPYTADETPQYITYTYDEYGRVVQTQKPGPNGTTITQSAEYNGLSVTTTDAKGHRKTTTKNVLDKVVRVEEADTILEYEYDSIGNLVKTIPNGNQAMAVEMSYDVLGNKIGMKDPDMGEWHYSYNALGQLISQTDAKGQTMSIEYDKLGRKIKETTADGVSTWVYDTASHGLGKLASESNGKITKKYSYDIFGRVAHVTTEIENRTFTQSYSYNAQGKLAKTVQPNGFELINSYNENGYLESIKSPAQQIEDFDRDHFEQLLEKMMANGLDYYKKSLEYSDKAKRLRGLADYYMMVAKHYGVYEKRFYDYAKRLRVYAKRYEYYGKKYATYSQRYRSYANYYYNRANFYFRYWRWGRLIASWYIRIGNRYSYYARRYAYWSQYYLNKAKEYENRAYYYETFGDLYAKWREGLIDSANSLYAQADALEVKAKEFKRLALQQEMNEDITDAYKEILADANYVYHYKVLEQNSLGKVTKYLSGNGLVTEDVYDETGAMTDSKTGYTFDDGVRSLHYEYDANYNVTSREDKKLGVTQTFGYDQLDRVTWTTATSNTIGFESNNYEYDVYGNLIHKDGRELLYTKGNHQVTALDDGTAYEYDANGNMVKNGEATIGFNAHNKVVDIKENGTHIHFAYDMNQKRYKKSEGLKDTYYLGKTYEYQTHTNGSETHKYMIYANGKVVTVHTEATEVQLDGEKLTTYETRYLHYDSLGSVDAITNQQGEVVQRTAYKPFGEQMELIKPKKSITNRGYTGHEHIEGTKFIHMNARLYDPTIGRFLSADTIIQDPYDSQSYNRYSYVRNNPLKYVDPTGHLFGIGGSIKRHWNRHRHQVVGAVVMVVGAVVSYYYPPAGAALMSLGASMFSYDPNQPESQRNQISFSTTYSYNTSWGQTGGGLTENQQSAINQNSLTQNSFYQNTNSVDSMYQEINTINKNGELETHYIPSKNANLKYGSPRGTVSLDYLSRRIHTELAESAGDFIDGIAEAYVGLGVYLRHQSDKVGLTDYIEGNKYPIKQIRAEAIDLAIDVYWARNSDKIIEAIKQDALIRPAYYAGSSVAFSGLAGALGASAFQSAIIGATTTYPKIYGRAVTTVEETIKRREEELLNEYYQ